jgi:hypothetical protein
MSVTHHADPVLAAGMGAAYPCLAVPQVRGLAALQARLVDRIKRGAILHLHASAGGERLLLRLYLDGEEASQRILQDRLTGALPDWIARQIAQHLAEEQGHTALFAAALGARGAEPASQLAPDGLSRRKMARWRRLEQRYAPRFGHGALVPAYATALCAEQMAMRIMGRHCATIGAQHALFPLFSRVLGDEHRHVRLCAHTLQRLVAPHEAHHLARLLAEIRTIDAAFGISGAVAMYAAGVLYRAAALLPGRR